ncbi:Dabb family protein [Allomuricauda sp. M10]|uniref:Dabb family protein n=1 Tax=Allomuricauda sp. M10 TaxID=2683292 RepID=UPI001D186A98|nr:Dabb family protein [Muricauda sp. M10]
MKTNLLILFLLVLVGCNSSNKEVQQNETEMEKPTSQLRHVVLFQFKDTSTPEDVDTVEAAFEELPSKISEIKGFEWGLNNSPENLNKGLTHCFFLTFDSEKDRDTYLTHPAHVAFGDVAGPHIQDVVVVDYWMK